MWAPILGGLFLGGGGGILMWHALATGTAQFWDWFEIDRKDCPLLFWIAVLGWGLFVAGGLAFIVFGIAKFF